MENIIRKIQDGDEFAFKQLSQSIEKDLYKIAKTRLNNEDDIKDAIQNTMINVYKNLKKLQNVEFFKTWMIRILINECNKIYNSDKKKNNVLGKLKIKSTPDSDDSTIQDINDKLNFEYFIDKLNYEERIVVTLYYNSQLSYKEISKIIKVNENTIKTRLSRAKSKLKKLYEEVEFHEFK